ncbi:MAG: alpha/beta hydrolase [Desulfobacteraceae bacterium]|nr:alpha/beta hydrolase [Desulfobacteraceae bacterium]
MPYFTCDHARIYFEDNGAGEPIIAVAGLIENTAYWRLPGVADRLAEQYRFVSMDMRGHGYTVVDEDFPGFDAKTVGKDITALAEHLGIDRFHLLTHSTGGFAAVRHAMADSGRFASLILTNTGSATSPVQGDQETIDNFHEAFARSFEKYDWDAIFANLRQNPGPFFKGIVESQNSEAPMAMALEMARRNDRHVVAEFVRSFYKDPDPRVADLRGIDCPVLVITGEKDDLFVESSRLMAREIPGAQLLEYEGVGHMSALEAPQRLADDVAEFVRQHCTVGK